MDETLRSLLQLLSLPEFGLSTVFVVALVSATLLPAGSEWVVLGFLKLEPDLFWTTMLVATAGNTLGGAISWWMGYGAERAYERAYERTRERGARERKPSELRALKWLQQFGPRACLLSWLPVVGDPLCAVAGWLRLPFWPCLVYMAIGKFARYVSMTAALLWLFPGQWPV